LFTATQGIRQATHHLHAALEATDVAKGLMAAQLTLAAYAHILAVWAQAWAALENAVYASVWKDQLSGLLPVPRTEKALHDLEDVNALLHIRGTAPGPESSAGGALVAPAAASAAELVGYCYVMQGSSLGGKVIARHLQETLGLHADQGRSFFLQGNTDPLTWTQWCREADAFLATSDDRQQSLQGANAAFAFLIQAFSRAST